MQIFLNHAKHNENFHVCICTNYADNFFDWKIIVSFYIAIHYLKALAAHKNIQLPSSHFAIDKMCDPKKAENALGLTHNAWDWYTLLYQCSRTARYDGFIDTDTDMIIKKADHIACTKALNKFKNYMAGKGITHAKT